MMMWIMPAFFVCLGVPIRAASDLPLLAAVNCCTSSAECHPDIWSLRIVQGVCPGLLAGRAEYYLHRSEI